MGNLNSSLVSSDVVIAIDVLRSSTTILTALANGAKKVVPALTVEEALSISKNAPVILGGEINSIKPPFFQLGNSPLEYVRERVEDKTIVLYTSSGTRLLRFLATFSRKVLIGAIVNISALVSYLRREGFNEVSIITAGKMGLPALEDSYCAGLISKYLPWDECNRDAEVAMKVAELNIDVVKKARHALELIDLGLGRDVDYSLTPNKVKVLAGLDEDGDETLRGCIPLPQRSFS